MAITKTSDLPNSVVTRYHDQYLLVSAQRKEVYGQFVDWRDPIADDAGWGGTQDIPLFGELDPVESALTEDADVTPTVIADANVTITPAEYGRTVATTQLARFQSRVSLMDAAAAMVARDRINSIDRIIRRTICGRGSSYPTQTYMPNSLTTMANLDATNDTVSWAFINELRMRAKSTGMEPFADGRYVAVIHPSLEYDLINLTEWKSVGYYQVPDNIYMGEIGELAGVRFISSHQGRIHIGSGAPAQTATTLSAAAAAGATIVTVTSATGLAAGDYIAIGTVETESANPGNNLEMVLITDVAGSTLTVRGIGNRPGNFGLRFSHDAGEAVTEAPNVASIPILGRGSIVGIYGARTGRYGQPVLKTGLDYLDRFVYHGWYWYGGLARVENYVILGRVAVSKGVIGYN